MVVDASGRGQNVIVRTWTRVRTPLTLLARLLLGLVFAFSAITKITAPAAFLASVKAYQLLPLGLAGPFALALPWIEALIAVYLLIGLFLRPTAVVTALLLLIFTGALTISLARGNTAHGCGCFSGGGPLASFPPVIWLAGGDTITPFDVARDLVFVGLAAAVYWGDRYTLSVQGLLRGRPLDDEQDDDADMGGRDPAPAGSAVAGRTPPKEQ